MNMVIIFGVALLIIICGYAYAKYRDEKEHKAIWKMQRMKIQNHYRKTTTST